MKNLAAFLCLTFAVLLFSAGVSFALSPCPEDPNQRFHNCFGTYTYDNGDKYVGEYRDDKRHGHGTYTTTNGSKYVGEWRDNKKHGQGTETFADGAKYVGEYKNGESHGQGTFTWSNGSKYVGEHRDGIGHGQGTYTNVNGNKYVGEWRHGNKHGQGTYTFASDGEVQEGVWKNNEFQYARKDPKVKERCKKADRTFECKVARREVEKREWEQKQVEKERIAKEQERIAKEQERIAKEKREQEQIVRKKREAEKRERQLEQEQIAREKREKQERKRIAKEIRCKGDDESKWHNCEGIIMASRDVEYVGVYKVGEAEEHGIFEGVSKYDVKYVGEYKNGMIHGQGTITWSNGNKYVGELSLGKLHGQGTYTNDGVQFVGEFRDDEAYKHITESDDNIRLALDILNYTSFGDKSSRWRVIPADVENCVFYYYVYPDGFKKLYVNHIIPDTVQIYTSPYEAPSGEIKYRPIVEFSGDQQVLDDELSGKLEVPAIASQERLIKAWRLLFSKACKGASPDEF